MNIHLPGLTYLGQAQDWSWGAQFRSTIRLGENDDNYTLGNRWGLTAWAARLLCRNASLSLRLDGETWGDIDGADPQLNPLMVPTAVPDRRAGTRLDLLLGLNIYFSESILRNHRLAIEGGIPVYQHLDGPQLETDWLVTGGWQFAW